MFAKCAAIQKKIKRQTNRDRKIERNDTVEISIGKETGLSLSSNDCYLPHLFDSVHVLFIGVESK
jgi:hypothetical protein